MLHDKDDVPLVAKNGFVVSPGMSTKVSVSAEYVSQKRKKLTTVRLNNSLNIYVSLVCAIMNNIYVLYHVN